MNYVAMLAPGSWLYRCAQPGRPRAPYDRHTCYLGMPVFAVYSAGLSLQVA